MPKSTVKHPLSGPVSLSSLAILWSVFLVYTLINDSLNLDLTIADRVYLLTDNHWWRDNFFTATVIHHWGKYLSILMALAVLCGYALTWLSPPAQAWRKPLLYLLLSVLLSTLLVGVIKQLVNIDCPWSLARYGGDSLYFSLWETRPTFLPRSACFPAGHASGGYSWLALYFFSRHSPDQRWLRYAPYGLALGFCLGLVFGVGQQLRGAHFFSHDLWTLILCWSVSAILAKILFQKPSAITSMTVFREESTLYADYE